MAFASVSYPGRCLAVELAISWAYWKLPKGNSPRTQDPNRTFRPSELFRPGASSDSFETPPFSSSFHTLVVFLRPLHQPRRHVDRRPFPQAPHRRGPLAVLPENDRPSMVSAFLEVLHHALPLGLCAVNGRGHPEQGLVSLPIILIIHNWHPA